MTEVSIKLAQAHSAMRWLAALGRNKDISFATNTKRSHLSCQYCTLMCITHTTGNGDRWSSQGKSWRESNGVARTFDWGPVNCVQGKAHSGGSGVSEAKPPKLTTFCHFYMCYFGIFKLFNPNFVSWLREVGL